MHDLIRDLFLKYLDNPVLRKMGDSAKIGQVKEKIAFTTDSFVVKPLFFPGGDIGKLAVCGTVNDLLVSGFKPVCLSCAMIIEEGFSLKELEKITRSIARAGREAGVNIVTGDLKVVERSSCDGLFINTSGIGRQTAKVNLDIKMIRPGDQIIITGTIGEHGIAVLSKRKELGFNFEVKSDCAALSDLLIPILKEDCGVKFMRDPTRGGLATSLNEIAEGSNFGIRLDEEDIPVSANVRAACLALGFDPLYIACEGRAVIFAESKKADKILRRLKKHPQAKGAAIIGEVVKENKAKVCLKTKSGGLRFVDMLAADILPRIC